jgi:hypothetical protein
MNLHPLIPMYSLNHIKVHNTHISTFNPKTLDQFQSIKFAWFFHKKKKKTFESIYLILQIYIFDTLIIKNF